ncbi:hypothetical protein LAZ67_7000271 [Cordylochernes scorpioides]|uniref:Uncharacterized protein n=1 Tax=Cordylochernes scorpioides TaxID=51811 RepID=A0ABY6KQ30_9ARAC|nr:hypothetical protein LAZ67_7000271 [Cordylochernes scorpioides]
MERTQVRRSPVALVSGQRSVVARDLPLYRSELSDFQVWYRDHRIAEVNGSLYYVAKKTSSVPSKPNACRNGNLMLHMTGTEQKGQAPGERVNACEDWLLNIHENINLLTKVITGDETWVSVYDPETKRQSSQWLPKYALKPKKARISKLKKVLFGVFFRSPRHCAL